jgi:HEAT repeat protein
MSDISERQGIESLLNTLKDRHWRTRQDAVEALVTIGEPAVIPLLHALDTRSVNRFDVVRALGRIGDPRAVEPLIDVLDTTNHFLTQEAAIGLGNIGDARAISPLIDVFRLEWDDTETITTWQKAAEALAALGEPTLLPLLAALDDEDDNVRHWSAVALGKLTDPRAVEPLLHALQDEKSLVRAVAAEALGQIGESRAIDPLVALLKDEDHYVRLRTCYALGDIGGVSVFDPLVRGLSDLEPDVRSAAVVNLGRIHGMHVPGLDPDPAPERRRAAIESLKRVQGEHVLDLFLDALRDPAGKVCAAAAHALGQLGDERALPALQWIQDNDSGYAGANKVKDAAAWAIQRIQEQGKKI